MWYAETLSHGRWHPNKFAEKPDVKKDCLAQSEGHTGPKIRNLTELIGAERFRTLQNLEETNGRPR